MESDEENRNGCAERNNREYVGMKKTLSGTESFVMLVVVLALVVLMLYVKTVVFHDFYTWFVYPITGYALSMWHMAGLMLIWMFLRRRKSDESNGWEFFPKAVGWIIGYLFLWLIGFSVAKAGGFA